MSGHSKWSTIKHKKAANDAARSGIFTKVAANISITAKKGGGDPEKNFSLRLAIEKARAVNMPKDRIEKAIEKGIGKSAGELEELVIEGYGPEGVAVIVDVLTDSRNRTVAELKNLMEKNGGRMGEPGSVMYQFDIVGIIEIEEKLTSEQELSLIDLGILEFESLNDQTTVYCELDKMEEIAEKIESMGYKEISLQKGYVPKVKMVKQGTQEIENFMTALEDYHDVQGVYSNL